MRILRFVVIAVFLLALTMVLVSCGGSKSSAPTKTTSAPKTTTTQATEPAPTTTEPTTPVSPKLRPKPKGTHPANPRITSFPKTAWKGKRLVTILIVGSDGRNERAGGTCPPARANMLKGTRADALHLIVFNTQAKRTTIINIPRDSYVSIPGYGRDRINASLALGGMPLLITTVEQLTGITVDYYVVTTFCGLRKVIDYLGGIVMKVPQNFGDRTAIFYGRKGCSRTTFVKQGWQKISGCQALFLSRDRHDVPGGDFGRTANQAKVLIAILKRFQYLGRTASGMFRVLHVIEMSWKQKLIGTNISHTELIRLMNTARGLKVSAIGSYTLNGWGCMIGQASMVCLSSSNSSVLHDIRTDGIINGH